MLFETEGSELCALYATNGHRGGGNMRTERLLPVLSVIVPRKGGD